MARKNNQRSEVSGSIHFDSRTKTVMAEATHDNIKEKVQAVREVVPGKSNNEVVLVLQYYDYNVERAIQAYLEDGAKVALQEWNFTGSKPNKKRKNKKKGSGEKAGNKPGSVTPSANSKAEPAVNGKVSLLNGDAVHESKPEPVSPVDSSNIPPVTTTSVSKPEASLSASTATAPSSQTGTATLAEDQPQRLPHTKGRGGHGDSHQHSPRERTISEMSTGSGMGDGHHKKPHQGLEKAIKDLHRQTTSLERLRLLLDHEIDRSIKSMKSVFEELRQGLNNREAQLAAEMDVLKQEASEMLEMRQTKAIELKRQVDRSDRLTDKEVTELRAEIKHFVSERRHDEDLGHTTRFLFDSDHVLDEFKKFGEVIHVKSMYSARRASISSVASSSISHEGNHVEDLLHSPEINELQDRLKNSLKLQNSPSRDPVGVHSVSIQNGPSSDDFIRNKPSQRREQNPRQRPQSGSSRGGNLDSQSLGKDVSSGKPSVSSSLQPTALQTNNNFQSNQGSPPSYSTNNTGSPGRGGRGSSAQGVRGAGRGRGRGGRGGGYGRGGQSYGNERSRPPSSQGEGGNSRMYSTTSNTSGRMNTRTDN